MFFFPWVLGLPQSTVGILIARRSVFPLLLPRLASSPTALLCAVPLCVFAEFFALWWLGKIDLKKCVLVCLCVEGERRGGGVRGGGR